jgi:hypothetical protein
VAKLCSTAPIQRPYLNNVPLHRGSDIDAPHLSDVSLRPPTIGMYVHMQCLL